MEYNIVRRKHNIIIKKINLNLTQLEYYNNIYYYRVHKKYVQLAYIGKIKVYNDKNYLINIIICNI